MRGRTIAVVVALALVPAAAHAQSAPQLPTNDFEGAVGLLYGQTPAPAPVQRNEPPLAPAPRADCDKDSTPLAGMQGRVTQADVRSPQAAKGWTCNLSVVSHVTTPGGFRVWRYTDPAGHTCAYYDTSLLGPLNVVSLAAAPTQGTVVLDMADPAKPVETARLTGTAMLSPHESLNLSPERGLLAAELGTAGTAPGVMSIYDVKTDCRHPTLLSEYAAGPVGHESGFSPDGRTFWIGGGQGILAVDVTNPRNPFTIATINIPSHGINFSDDGNTLYETNVIDGGMAFLDVSEIQARKPNPQVREISRLTWDTSSIPQNTNPMTIGGHPYLLEFDEFAFGFNGARTKAGAARLIDIADPATPKVTSNLRLEVNMPANQPQAANADPNFVPNAAVSYGAHYCNVPREVDPVIAACAFLNSGLRIFNIQDPKHPREVAYFVSPPGTAQGNTSDADFSQPAFDPERREVYFTDATTGFWNVRLTKAAWPQATASAPGTTKRRCTSRRRFRIRIREPRRGRIAHVKATLRGKRLAVRRRGGRRVAIVDLRGRPRRTFRVRIVVRTTRGRTYSDSRTYHPCRRRA